MSSAATRIRSFDQNRQQ